MAAIDPPRDLTLPEPGSRTARQVLSRALGRLPPDLCALSPRLALTEARARDLERVTCEVNLVPPNPGSLAFHHRLGFERMGELQHIPGEKEVAMLVATA